jgi:hypothetical protein
MSPRIEKLATASIGAATAGDATNAIAARISNDFTALS